MENLFAATPIPPYYAVIFTSKRTTITDDYDKMANKMIQLARKQDGFLGIESARNSIGITISYWKDINAISNWKNQIDHLEVQQKGKSDWYQTYKVRIAKVTRDYEFIKSK